MRIIGRSRIPDDVGERAADVGAVHLDLPMIGLQMLDHLPLIVALVEARVAEADREGRQIVDVMPLDERGQDGRVEAAAQVRRDRHVGAQLQTHGVVQQSRARCSFQYSNGALFVLVLARGSCVASSGARCGGRRSSTSMRPGGSSSTPLNDVRGGTVTQRRRDLADRDRIDLGAQRAVREQRLHLRAEQQRAVRQRRVEQRPDADAIAHQHEPAARVVPQRDRELAVQVVDEVEAVLLVEMNDRFGVAVRVEDVAALLEVGAQLDVVEDLAVERDPDRAVLVAERLLAGAQVDDGQPAMTEPDAGLARDSPPRPARDASARASCAAAPPRRPGARRRCQMPATPHIGFRDRKSRLASSKCRSSIGRRREISCDFRTVRVHRRRIRTRTPHEGY